MRNDTSVAPSATPSSRVTASTASTGEAASAASRIRANLPDDSAAGHLRSIGPGLLHDP